MKSEKRKDGWWVTDSPDDVGDMGPYETKEETEQIRRGVQRALDSLKETPVKKR